MRPRLLAPFACALVALVLPSAALAQQTFRPTRFDDPVGGTCQPTDCSLRQAVDVPTSAEPRTIILKVGRYELTQGPLQLNNNAGETIQGAGARLTTIDGNSVDTVIIGVEGNDLAEVDDVTITGGNATGFTGGAISVDGAATLALNRSTVTGNRSDLGGGIAVFGTLNASASTIAGNVTNPPSSSTAEGGGGIYVRGEANLTNVTISGNTAVDPLVGARGGGIFVDTGDVQARNVTIAGNTADVGGGIWNNTGVVTLFSTLVSGNTPATCVGTPFGGDHSMGTDNCGLSSTANPLLGSLANNGGPTDTRALSPASPAINAGAGCPTTDQRGASRVGACDIGAYEYRPPRLTVIKKVVNDEGGTARAADFSVRVLLGGNDVAGSPQPGSATGTTYTLTPGSYAVGEFTDSRYVGSFSGDCAANGAITLAEGQVRSCTMTNNDKPPVVGKIVNAEPEGGTVTFKLPKGKKFRKLTEGQQLPVGTIVDTRKGRIGLTAAANKKGGRSNADFYDGLFKLGQTKGKKPTTVLTLTEKLTGCKATGTASAAAKKKKKRRLWGDGHGRFQTKGKRSAATVVGTKWLVEDRCTSTLTKVARGRVKVRDFVKHKTVFVKKGHRYIARAK